MPIKTHSVADAVSKDFKTAAVRLHAKERGVAFVAFLTYVAGRSHRNVKQTVRPEANELPTMHTIMWEAFIHNHRLRRGSEMFLDLVEAKDALDLSNIECAVSKGDAVWRRKIVSNDIDAISLLIFGSVNEGVNIARHRANK